MNERERWIVYPLLFLALGAALRDKLFDRTTTKSIVCQELTVVDDEPVANRPVRILAKIGRTETASGSLPHGYLLVNGQVEVVDDLAGGPQSAPITLAKVGPAAASQGTPPGGLLIINGQLNVQGLVNARQYAYQGMPIVLPGVSWPALFQAMEQSIQSQQQKNAPNAQPPENRPTDESPPLPVDPADGEDKPSATTQPDE